MTDANDTDDETYWSRPAILRRVVGGFDLTDSQNDVLVAAVRNPDASATRVCSHADVHDATMANLIWGMENGALMMDDGDGNIDYDSVLNKGQNKFVDLTVKQRASVDFLARHPDAFDELTYQAIAERVATELGVTLHWSSVHDAKANRKHQVHDRRDWYERRGDEDKIQPFADMDDAGDSRSDERTLRQKLRDAGVDELPDSNLDGLPTAEESTTEGRQRGLRHAAESRSTSTDDTGDDSVGRGETVAVDVPDDESADANAATGSGGSADTTERQVGNARYKGPSTGLNLAGDRPSKVLVGPEDADQPSVTEELERLRDECGPYGQDTADRPLEVDDREALEHELKVLRIIVSQQGEYIDQIRRALDNLHVSVDAGFTIPKEDDNGGDGE